MRIRPLRHAAALAALAGFAGALPPAAAHAQTRVTAQGGDPEVGRLLARADRALEREAWDDAALAFERLCALEPDNADFAAQHAMALHRAGHYEAAAAAHRRAAQFAAIRAPSLYNVACAEALLGHSEAALDALEEAIDAGWDNRQAMRTDPDLAAIRDTMRFERLLERRPGSTLDLPPLTWDTLEERMALEAEAGFSGSVLVVRDGEIVFDRAYGMANRAERIPNRPDTIYCVGSTPIDFTKAGILQLWEEGKVSLDDPITEYFDNVPPDKQGITIEHLMTGRSGLRNFHDIPSDRDPDHSYIDRDEAMRRIFSFPLLFEPGEGDAHSHSAWGVVAAIIEIVSGQTYEDFTRERLLGPAGMDDTFNYGKPIPEERMAVGYSDVQDGEINAPPYWGPTSWLVKGSGGMVSTTHDMHRWHQAIYGGLLSERALRRYNVGPGGYNEGGSQYGYVICSTEGRDTRFYFISNALDHPGRLTRLADDLAELVWAAELPPYTLGIMFNPDSEDRVTLLGVAPGGAAERDGLREGDTLLTADGEPFGVDPLRRINDLLETGRPIRFEVARDGERVVVTVRPNPR
ncbi:MAG: serine hydrolase [Phycisphaerales bacterium]